MRQPTKADLSLIAALTGASLLVACNGSDDAPAAAAQPFANPTPVAQAYVAPPRLCAPATGDQPEPGVNGHIPKSAMFDAVTNPDGFQGYWCGVKQVAQHTLFGRGAFGDLQIKTSGSSRCAYASNRDGAAGSDTALTSGIIVFDVKTPTIMRVVPASGDTTVVGTAVVVGTVGRRGAAGAPGVEDGGLASGPNVALAISAMPASEPSTPVTSIGMIKVFWFGESASSASTFMYLSATK